MDSMEIELPEYVAGSVWCPFLEDKCMTNMCMAWRHTSDREDYEEGVTRYGICNLIYGNLYDRHRQ